MFFPFPLGIDHASPISLTSGFRKTIHPIILPKPPTSKNKKSPPSANYFFTKQLTKGLGEKKEKRKLFGI
jgi:hypothetical protein